MQNIEKFYEILKAKHIDSDTPCMFTITMNGWMDARRTSGQGHLAFDSFRYIHEISVDDMFLDNEEEEKAEYYVDSNGGELISAADFKSGFGRIERDGNYDTVYVQKLDECDDEELKLIAAYMDIDTDLVKYGWQEYEEEVPEEQ